MRVAYLLGAGSSRGTLPDNCPTAPEFFKHLSQRYRVSEPLEQVRSHLNRDGRTRQWSEIGLEEVWSCIDYYYKFSRRGSLNAVPWMEDAEVELKRLVVQIYGSVDRLADQLSDERTLCELVQGFNKGDIVVSFNYDTLIERLCRKIGRCLTSVGDELECDRINFAKPHGSLSWVLCHAPKSVLAPGPLTPPWYDSIPAWEVSPVRVPLVLGAVPIKSELMSEIQQFYGVPDLFRVIMRQWKATMEAIRRADKIVVVGYSFPPEDHYGRFLFQEAMRRRLHEGRKRPAVEFYDPNVCVVKSIRDAFLDSHHELTVTHKGKVE